MAEAKVKKEKNQNIQVFVRIRPINAREREIKSVSVIETPSNREILVRQGSHDRQSKKFTYDKVFGPESKQLEVYSAVVHPLIEEVLSGYSCTVFAYGQTGTGKTFTMAGGNPAISELPDPSSWQDDPLAGVIPRCLNQLFDELRVMQVEFSIRVSYLELYNEELFDLLSPIEETSRPIRIYEDPAKKGSVVVHGLEEIPVTCKNEVYKIMAKGQEKRKTAATLMNAQSSRSHTVFSISVLIKENSIDGEEFMKAGKLNLVDLAGSENISKAGNDKRERARETVNINQSLLTLGRVITALVERAPHIPYRESKLTRLLQDSLGGRTKTSIIATISPGHKDLDETLSTLDYAYRAKNIQNKPEINQKIIQKVVLREYNEEIERLRRDLTASREKDGVYLANETYNEINVKLAEQNREITDKILQIRAYEDEIKKREEIYNSIAGSLAIKSEELDQTTQALQETNEKLDQRSQELNKTSKSLHSVHKTLGSTQRMLLQTKDVSAAKSYVIKIQSDTEKELTLQAKTLVSVAEQTSNDTKGLHDALDKRRHLDTIIKSTSQIFGNDLETQINQIAQQNEMLLEFNSKLIADSNNNVDKYTNINQQSSEQLTNIMCTVKNRFSDLLQSVETNIVQMNDTLIVKDTDSNELIIKKIKELMKSVGKFLVNDLNPAVEQFYELNETQNNTLKNIREMHNMQVQENLDRVSELSKQNKIWSSNLQNYLVASFAAQQSRLHAVAERHNKIAEEEAANNKLISKKTKQIIEDMLCLQNIQSNHFTYAQQEIQAITDDLQEVTLENNNIEANIGTTLKQNDVENQTNSDHCKKGYLDKLENSNNLYLELDQSLTTQKSLLSEISKQTLNTVNEVKSNLKCVQINIEEAQQNMTQEIKNVLSKNEKILECGVDSLEQSYAEQLDILTQQTKNTDSFLSEQITCQKIAYDDLNRFRDGQAVQIQNMLANVSTFLSNDLKVYSPTGQTPIRKEYSFPRVLASTMPHDQILERLRNNRSLMHQDSASDSTVDSVVDLTASPSVLEVPVHHVTPSSTLTNLDINRPAPIQVETSPPPIFVESETNLNFTINETDTKENFKIPINVKGKPLKDRKSIANYPRSSSRVLIDKNL